MDFFGRVSPKPIDQAPEVEMPVSLDRDTRHHYEKLHGVFSEQAHLVENFATQLEAYEMSLRETKKCLHALTETMADLYHKAGPNGKEFKVALEDEERLLEYKAHTIHKIIDEDVERFRQIHAHGKQLIEEREAHNKRTKQAIDGLRRLYQTGKGGDRRVPKIVSEVSHMIKELEDANDVAIRDLPLAILSRGAFISETFPKYFQSNKEHCEESLKISETLCSIVEALHGIHVGTNDATAHAFEETSKADRRKFLQKYKMIPDDADFEPSDEEDEDLIVNQKRISTSYPSRAAPVDRSTRASSAFAGGTGGDSRRSMSPSPDMGPAQRVTRGHTWQRASPSSSSEDRQGGRSGSPNRPFNTTPTRLFDRDGKVLI